MTNANVKIQLFLTEQKLDISSALPPVSQISFFVLLLRVLTRKKQTLMTN